MSKKLPTALRNSAAQVEIVGIANLAEVPQQILDTRKDQLHEIVRIPNLVENNWASNLLRRVKDVEVNGWRKKQGEYVRQGNEHFQVLDKENGMAVYHEVVLKLPNEAV